MLIINIVVEDYLSKTNTFVLKKRKTLVHLNNTFADLSVAFYSQHILGTFV